MQKESPIREPLVMPFEIIIDTHRKNGITKLSTLKRINKLTDTLMKYDEFSRPLSIIDPIKYSKQEPQVSILTYNQDENFVLKIKDNGIGMSPTIQRKVFDKFYRAESGNVHNVKGHGLGLAYVKKIIDLHKGKIYLNSKNGIGTTFTIFLPNNY